MLSVLSSLVLCLGLTVAPAHAAAADKAKAPVDFAAGDNPWLAKDLSKDDLLPALELSADYLVRNLQADGQFIYNKDPLGRCCTKKSDRYSLIRHLGAVYALLRAHQVIPNADYLAAAKKGLDFVLGFTGPYGVHKTVVRGFGNALSLGENGFLLIDAVLYDQLAGKAEHTALAKDLEAFLTASLVFDGPLATSEGWAESQAVIGIVHYHKFVERDPDGLAAAERWLERMSKERKQSHWSVQATDWLRSVDPGLSAKLTASALDGMEDLARPTIAAGDGVPTRLVGSRKSKLFSCNATARNEGLLAAYATATALGKEDKARYFWARAKEHLAFALQFVYGLPGNIYENDADLTRTAKLFNLQGGLANDPKAAAIRIDYVAHHIRAMVTYLQSPNVPVAAGLKMEELESYADIDTALPVIK